MTYFFHLITLFVIEVTLLYSPLEKSEVVIIQILNNNVKTEKTLLISQNHFQYFIIV